MEVLLPVIFGSLLIYLFTKALINFEESWRKLACGPAGVLMAAAAISVIAAAVGMAITLKAVTLVLAVSLIWIATITVVRYREQRDPVLQ